MYRLFCLFAVVQTVSGSPIEELFVRILGKHADKFAPDVLESSGSDAFTIVAKLDTQGRQIIRGNTPGSVASGLGFFLNNVTHMQVRTWSGNNANFPETFPTVSEDIHISRTHKWGYYLNVCTFSYTMVWWDWARWEEEIDWMALSGINLPLAFVGQEYVWEKTFQEFGLSSAEIATFFSGPAFAAWNRMGNMEGWGGLLPVEFINGQKDLQVKILQRMEDLKMTPVLPAFAGHVPNAFLAKLPNASYVKSPDWGHFGPPNGSVLSIEPTDPLYIEVGKTFIEQYRSVFNTTSVYFNGDQYNELTPQSGNTSYLTASSKAMYSSLTAAEPNAVWVMQGWLFVSESFWTVERAQAYLAGVPDDHSLVLDLESMGKAQYSRLDSYWGKPYIFSLLHDFGGRDGMGGALDLANTKPHAADVQNTSVSGFGLTMEGTRQNYVIYELMLQNMWRTTPHANMTEWLYDYSHRRYGARHAQTMRAWDLLHRSVYTQSGVVRDIITITPELDMTKSRRGPTAFSYNSSLVEEAMVAMLLANDTFAAQETYVNDLVDVARQAMSDKFMSLSQSHTAAYHAKNATALDEIAATMLEMIADQDTLLLSSKFFLLGTWLSNARSWGGNNVTQQDLYEWNARNQITLWGPEGNILDYAGKEWGGLVKGFYQPRWALYFKQMSTGVAAGDFNQTKFNADCLALDKTWQHKTDPFPTSPSGNTPLLVRGLIDKYFSHLM